jgi:hypothetical protein
MLIDTELAASKRRFGLFSQPPSTAIGDDSPFRTKIGTSSFTQREREKTASPSLFLETCCLDLIARASTAKVSLAPLAASTSKILTSTRPKENGKVFYNCTPKDPFTKETSFLPQRQRHSKIDLTKSCLPLQAHRRKSAAEDIPEKRRFRESGDGCEEFHNKPDEQGGKITFQTLQTPG